MVPADIGAVSLQNTRGFLIDLGGVVYPFWMEIRACFSVKLADPSRKQLLYRQIRELPARRVYEFLRIELP